MDIDGVDPLALSLDEVINLNRLRNTILNNPEQQSSSSSNVIQIKKEPSDIVNGHNDEELTSTIQNRLRETENGNVFDRLGWKKPGNRAYNRHQNHQNLQALRVIRQAKQFKHRNVRVVNTNSRMMRPPLTTNVLRMHNRTPGNFFVKRISRPGSVCSMSTTSSRLAVQLRHSLKKCLDPNVQQVIQNMVNDDGPAVVTSDGAQLMVDHTLLKSFIPPSHCSSLPTYVRFPLND